MVEIKGLEKFAPKDFPGHVSCTVFLGGCNFRCPYCHNADLVLRARTLPSFPLHYFLSFLDSRKNWLDGICVSGGEPLLHQGLKAFLSLVKKRSLRVKLDTNGSFPSRLQELIKEGLLDFVAMDVKAPLERYEEVTKSRIDTDVIRESIEIIKNSGLDYVFRTTAVPGLVGADDVLKIIQLLRGAKIFQIQQFLPNNPIDSHYRQTIPYSKQEIQWFVNLAQPYFEEVRMEGV
ncbi:MAG: anaerobic ribonucleoside-triphosphate reductase activating protein [Candidatus Aminicenantes bacterium]